MRARPPARSNLSLAAATPKAARTSRIARACSAWSCSNRRVTGCAMQKGIAHHFRNRNRLAISNHGESFMLMLPECSLPSYNTGSTSELNI